MKQIRKMKESKVLQQFYKDVWWHPKDGSLIVKSKKTGRVFRIAKIQYGK